MTVTATTSAAPPLAAAASREQTGLVTNFETFLKLLTTQLKSQDPLSPMEPEKFTSQLVQFSTVEQALKTNRQLEQLIGLTRSSATAAALGMVGREVVVDGGSLLLDAGGGSTIYELPQPAASATVQIFDSGGRLVHSVAGPLAEGANRFDWDGKLVDGSRAEAGVYRVKIAAVDDQGREIAAKLERTARIASVETRDSGLVLVADGIALAPDAVRGAGAAAT